MFILFRVKGPFPVPFRRARNGAKLVTGEAKTTFWKQKRARKHQRARGCYVFAIDTGKRYRSGYIGLATKTLRGEIFTDNKLNRYNLALGDYKNGNPVLFFVIAPTGKGKSPNSKIIALEKHLIQTAKVVNPKLRNQIGTKLPEWGIAGVLRGGQGKVGAGATALREMIGIP